MRGGVFGAGFIAIILLLSAACDPLQGSGSGTQPSPLQFIHIDESSKSAIVTLIAGHPATDSQFNYDGYSSGALVLTVPTGWAVTIQCQNHGTVPNSCAIVSNNRATTPLDPSWSTPDPAHGLSPGESASFVFSPTQPGSYRIASLVGGNEASGMWLDLEVVTNGLPQLTASP